MVLGGVALKATLTELVEAPCKQLTPVVDGK
jgi:hypothetical protein